MPIAQMAAGLNDLSGLMVGCVFAFLSASEGDC